MNKDFIRALDEIEKEKGIKKDEILQALEKALQKSYEENYKANNVEISINHETGDTKVYALKEVVETKDDVKDSDYQITLEEALVHSKRAKIGQTIKIKVMPKSFLRVAAQKAKNIVIQQIRDAERRVVYDSYIDKKHELINCTVQRIDFNNIYVDLGKSEGVISERERVPGEEFNPGDRIKVYVKDVKETTKGAQIILSRKDPELVTRLFELEVPEISSGTVEIMSISREAGFRTKIAVYANDPSIDPVGAAVGVKGSRVNSIVEEINDEKIDIIVWSKDNKVYLSNSLSPAEVTDIFVDEANKEAVAFVPDDQLSLAIGKEGQNVRLAAKLTNWKIDIKGDSMRDEILPELEKNLIEPKTKTVEENNTVEINDNELLDSKDNNNIEDSEIVNSDLTEDE
ncbi:MAG: transcription termination factor NusA [Helcococcus sp.]|nr:transcription termination factor NusA [Helcococcus sp.]